MPKVKDNTMMPARVMGPSELVVFARADSQVDRADRLAAHLGAQRIHAADALADAPLALVLDDEGLSLVGGGMAMRADLTDMLPRLRPAALKRELLVRAAKIKDADGVPLAVDMTAGLGEDSLLLAAAGFEVVLFERDPVIAALLKDALRRASAAPGLAEAVSRMRLVEGDSVAGLQDLGRLPDVVYLDPMFPERRKSAAVKKKFQLLHLLEHPCTDQDDLMRAALAARPRKVVVKRPAKGPNLADIKPSYSLAGKAVRYDCIVCPRPAR